MPSIDILTGRAGNQNWLRSVYWDACKCLGRHETLVHCRQIEWITGAKLNLFSVMALPALAEALETPLTGTEMRLGLVAQRAQPTASTEAAEILGYGAAVPCVDLTRPYCPDGNL